MSVQTEADEKIDQASRQVQAALTSLNEVVVERCWGHENYTLEYKKKLARAHALLVEARDELGV